MQPSVVCGLCFTFVYALLHPPAQGQLQRASPHPSVWLPAPTCCNKVSKFRVTDPVKACYEQEKDAIRTCRIHAYIFVCETRQYCVDPSARWLPKALKRLEEMGIICTDLTKAPDRHATQIL